MISKIKNNYKLLGKTFSNVLYFLKNTSTKHSEKDGNAYVLINLDDKIMNQSGGRFFYLLCQYFEQAGFNVVVKTNLFFYLFLHPYKKLLLNKNYSLMRKMPTPTNSILSKHNGKEQLISVAHGVETIGKNSGSYSLPFPMHPVQVDSFNKAALQNLRQTKRTIKILFSGSWTQDQYKVSLDKYNVLTRSEVIRFIIEKFRGRGILKQVDDRDELTTLLQSGATQEQIIISEVKTRDGDWMKLLSLSDFFISPPGYKYPWCHNSIESMAVGAIPILQYNELFVPALVHMENCICFHNTSELETAITTALSLQQEDIQRMRKNVISYYDEHLSPEAIIKKIKGISMVDKKDIEITIPYIN